MRPLFEGENHESFGKFVNDAVEAYAKNKDMDKAVVKIHKSLQFFERVLTWTERLRSKDTRASSGNTKAI